MESSLFSGKRVRVQIKNTKPVLRDPGWKNGDYEDKYGIWSGIEGSMAKIILGRTSTTLIPDKYVQPMQPSLKGQNVVVLSEDLMAMECCIMTFGKDECLLRNRHVKLDPKSRISLATSTLAVVAG
jgi:hypothetical protein